MQAYSDKTHTTYESRDALVIHLSVSRADEIERADA